MIGSMNPGDQIHWKSPIFGDVGPGLLLEVGDETVLVLHPLTQEAVRIQRSLVVTEVKPEKGKEWGLE